MQKLTKTIVTTIVIMMLLSFFTFSFADITTMNPTDWKNQTTGNKIKTNDIKEFSASVISAVSVVGSAAAIITLIILGVKYMMGSAEEKAEYKKTLLPYIIGAVMVFGASVLTNVIYKMVQG